MGNDKWKDWAQGISQGTLDALAKAMVRWKIDLIINGEATLTWRTPNRYPDDPNGR